MGKASKKPRKRMNAQQYEGGSGSAKKKEEDWSFDEVARSKPRRR